MKQLLNIYFFIALLLSVMLGFLLLKLYQDPVYVYKKNILEIMKLREDGLSYTPKYIQKVRNIYNQELNRKIGLQDSLLCSDDSLFVFSLFTVVGNLADNANPYPVITNVGKESITGVFRMTAKQNFNIALRLKKVNNYYIADDISNLDLLLYYHPEYAEDLKNGRGLNYRNRNSDFKNFINSLQAYLNHSYLR